MCRTIAIQIFMNNTLHSHDDKFASASLHSTNGVISSFVGML